MLPSVMGEIAPPVLRGLQLATGHTDSARGLRLVHPTPVRSALTMMPEEPPAPQPRLRVIDGGKAIVERSKPRS